MNSHYSRAAHYIGAKLTEKLDSNHEPLTPELVTQYVAELLAAGYIAVGDQTRHDLAEQRAADSRSRVEQRLTDIAREV